MASKSSASGGLLKVIFLAHLVLSSWGMMSPFFVPNSYVYYNIIYMLALMWAIATNNIDSIIMALLINAAIIIMDAFALAFSWPRSGSSRERLYFGLAIANEVLRPVAAILLYRVFKERDTENQGIRGVFADVLGETNGASNQGYESIPQQNAPASAPEASSSASGGYQGNAGTQNV
ncbi:Type-1 angiotensin II receptor-associated protein [Orchesella cincta]|uniref:Type-1 angiotensin II receptor-associated protein n=1 Tax=Orchesella cincta TaxID=48709 RepID=A0A1D2NGH5_ORCCI|nr:Type-1 angiotensin II receptor-associated protein [Orchesella cincta]